MGGVHFARNNVLHRVHVRMISSYHTPRTNPCGHQLRSYTFPTNTSVQDETECSKPTERLAKHQPTQLPALAAPTNGLQCAENLSYHTFTSTIGPRGVSHSKTMVYFERVTQLCYHAILEVRGGITHPHPIVLHQLSKCLAVTSAVQASAGSKERKFDKSSIITMM